MSMAGRLRRRRGICARRSRALPPADGSWPSPVPVSHRMRPPGPRPSAVSPSLPIWSSPELYLGAAFAKHGTSFETRISVFDKCRGGERGGITANLAPPMSVDVHQLLARIVAEVPPRLELDAVDVARYRATIPFPGIPARASGFAATKSRATQSPKTDAHVSTPDAEDLGYTLREDRGRSRRRASVRRDLRNLPSASHRHPRRITAPDQAGTVGGHGVRCAPQTLLSSQIARRRATRWSTVRRAARDSDLRGRGAWRLSCGGLVRR